MVSLGLPHITVLSKCDLVEDKSHLKKYLNLEYRKKIVDLDDDSHIKALLANKGDVDKALPTKPVAKFFSEKYLKLSEKLREVVESYSLVSFLALDVTDEETIKDIIYHADNNIQFGEDQEPNENAFKQAESRMNNSEGSPME